MKKTDMAADNAVLDEYLQNNPSLRSAAEVQRQKDIADSEAKHEAEKGFVIHQAVEISKPAKQVRELDTYSASSLNGVQIERPPLIINNLIPVGLSVLAGAPKRGKSWLALAMGIAVSTGSPFLGMGTHTGDVLYLDLESRPFRIQDRLSTLNSGFPKRLRITHDSERIDTGLIDQINMFCTKYPETSLVVVDTIGRVKGGSKRGENAYESDTRIFSELQTFAQQHGIAILCVHHLRKSNGNGKESDPIERISGSMGLAGVCDAILLLNGKRGDNESTLYVTARDFDEHAYVLRFDSGRWVLQSADSEAYREEVAYNRSDVVRGILALIHSLNPPAWQGTATQLLSEIQSIIDGPLQVFNAKQLSNELDRMTLQLYNREGILVKRRMLDGRRIISVSKPNSVHTL